MKETRTFEITLTDGKKVFGNFTRPPLSEAIILFVHGSGSSRKSPRNQMVANILQNDNYATLLVDLLTEDEAEDRDKVFDCELLATRVMEVALWVRNQKELSELPMALFGASTGAGAALIAAAQWPQRFSAVISRGGRPDLAKDYLSQVRQPTLLIVGGLDEVVLRLNRQALDKLNCKKKMEIVPGATHLFEEPGKLEEVARLACHWLNENLKSPRLPFESRKSAAEQLAKRLRGRVFSNPIVAAIPRGGVVTGMPLAKELSAEMGLVFSRKLRHPLSSELAIGAICHDQDPVLTEGGVRTREENPRSVKEEIKRQREEIEERQRKFRDFTAEGRLQNRTVILTDDGIATGATVLAAAKYIRSQKPKELIVAVPVAARDSLELLAGVADEIISLATPPLFFSVGEFYKEFPQVDDEECLRLLYREGGKPKAKFLKSLRPE
jgi:dienelactone hydrolase